ncbi:TadE/TadG family type IV pilus assembly protein [Parvularcula sp. IMCC14364]|uniref:TadE/TadG family type IV pilus assembly protein n=1 Tax=Parvularcula sp. IMCC14364 TaxID=3067902 RepID=UPI002741C6DF|nr:TadE/TadG family type IV pilus assembly protein [Parvularcula sp. IMCC14364]
MPNKYMKKGLRRFLKETGGNVAMMTALVAGPLTLTLGGAVDLMRFAAAKAELRGAVDAGLLAAAHLDNDTNVETEIQRYLQSNLDHRFMDYRNVNVTVTEERRLNGKFVDINADITIDTFFLGMMGKDSVTVSVTSSGEQTYTAVEVALVVDISSSMNGSRLVNLRTAMDTFIETVLKEEVADITSISIIPFGGHVNVGDDYKHFANLDNEDDNDDTDHSDGHKYNGCFELLPEDYSDNTFELHDGEWRDITPHFWKYVNFNPWCPSGNNEAIFLSNNPDELKDLVEAFTLSDGTGMDIGAAWGLKALSPKMRGVLKGDFEDVRPTDYNSDTIKALVMMTDGGITPQFRPTQSGCIRARDNNLAHNDHKECQEFLFEDETYRHTKSVAVDYFEDVCAEAVENNILVFTIGFEISAGSNQDIYLRGCPQNESQYYFVESTDIEAAFSSIAASINGIRLTM